MKGVARALMAALLTAALAGSAAADGGANASGGATGSASGDEGNASVQAQSNAAAEASVEKPDAARAEARLKAIRARAAKMAAKEREAVEKRLAGIAGEVDVEASTQGEAKVADRLASEFQVTAEALASERTQFEAGWGELMLAHTLVANSDGAVTMEQLFALRSEGLGWGQIAHGIGLRARAFVTAARAQGLVARGKAMTDGKPARVESGASVAAGAGTTAGGATTRAGAGAGVGVGVTGKIVR